MRALSRAKSLPAYSHSIFNQCFGFTKTAYSGADAQGADGKMNLMLKALDAQEMEDFKLSPEDQAEAERRSKEYSRLKMQEHRLWQADLSTKLKLKHVAIEALPPELRAAALVPDYTPFPSNRHVFTDTPPHDEESVEAKPRQQVKSKRTIGTKRRS